MPSKLEERVNEMCGLDWKEVPVSDLVPVGLDFI